MNKFLITIFSILVFFSLGFPQNEMANLKSQIDTIQNDTIKVNFLRRLGSLYGNINYDSSMYFYAKAIALSQYINNTQEEAYVWRYIGIAQKIEEIQILL